MLSLLGQQIIPSPPNRLYSDCFGILLGILLTLSLPAVMVDAAYAALYVKDT